MTKYLHLHISGLIENNSSVHLCFYEVSCTKMCYTSCKASKCL